MTRPIRSPVVGVAALVLMQLLALALLVSRRSAFTGQPGVWPLYVVVAVLLPAATVLAAVMARSDRALPVVLAQAFVVFCATLPEAAFAAPRWLTFASLLGQAAIFFTGSRQWILPLVFTAECLLVDFAPGMTAEPPELGDLVLQLGAFGVPLLLLHHIRSLWDRLSDLTGRNDQLHASVLQLTNANTEFLEQATSAGAESALTERNRITRDLHDVVGQTLTNIIMMMDATLHRKVHEPEETVRLVKWVRKQAQTGLEDTRAVLYELRALRPQNLRGLRAFKKLIDTFGRISRVRTKVEWGNLPWTFDARQEAVVYLLIQASLSNSFRHGSATKIDIHFQVDQGVLNVVVQDNGRGGSDTSMGIGQQGMEERLSEWGGTVRFRSETFGYVVLATLPLVEVGHGDR